MEFPAGESGCGPVAWGSECGPPTSPGSSIAQGSVRNAGFRGQLKPPESDLHLSKPPRAFSAHSGSWGHPGQFHQKQAFYLDIAFVCVTTYS